MPISTSVIDKKIARIKSKLAKLDDLQKELKRLEGLRERVAELEAEFPTRSRGPRGAATKVTKKTAAKKGTGKRGF